MRRTPIACCLEEGGAWVPWHDAHWINSPIRLYDDGWIEDDIFAKAMARGPHPTTRKRRNRLSPKDLQIMRCQIGA